MNPIINDIKQFCLLLENEYQSECVLSDISTGLPVHSLYRSCGTSLSTAKVLDDRQIRSLTCEIYHHIVNAETIKLSANADASLTQFNEDAFNLFCELSDLSAIPIGYVQQPFCKSIKARLSNLEIFKDFGGISPFLNKVLETFTFTSNPKSTPHHSKNYLPDVSLLTFSMSDSVQRVREQMKSKTVLLNNITFTLYDVFMSYFDALINRGDLVICKHEKIEPLDTIARELNVDNINELIDQLSDYVASCLKGEQNILLDSGNAHCDLLEKKQVELLSKAVSSFQVSDFVIGELHGGDVVDLDLALTTEKLKIG